MRIILTFPTLHHVLAAEKVLRENSETASSIRPTPTPPGLTSAVCGMSLEITRAENENLVLACLEKNGKNPVAVHQLSTK
ncbi:MAG: DUF3343 domain-containing protein [Leptolyngbya sp.]|nr:DUF3343 domain-containing protein [Candidatus Melainabacteria bacterium]